MRAIPLQGIWCSDNLLNEEKRDDESQYLQRRLQQRLSELLVDKSSFFDDRITQKFESISFLRS
jgi:hypothetical protein